MFDASYQTDTRQALADFVQVRAGHPPQEVHPLAERWFRDGLPFLTVAHRAGFLAEPTPAALARALTTSDLPGLLVTAAAQSVQGDTGSGLVEHRDCCLTRDVGDLKNTEFAEVHLGDVEASPELFAPNTVPVADLSNLTYGKVSRYVVAQLIARSLLVNGNLDVVAQILAASRTALLRTEAKAFSTLLESNGGNGPVLGDGDSMFTAANSVSGGLNVTGLNDAAEALRTMSVAGSMSGARPGILLVPADSEFTAGVLVQTLPPGTLRLAVSPWLTSGRYYVFSRPEEQAAVVRIRMTGWDWPRSETGKRAPNYDALAVQTEHMFGFHGVSRLGVCKVTA